MEKFIKGDVVIVPFPFSDLSSSKRRPALVLSGLRGNDIVLCQITSKEIKDVYAISLNDKDFKTGKLAKESNIRPNRLFTADKKIILYKAGHISAVKVNEVIDKVIAILKE